MRKAGIFLSLVLPLLQHPGVSAQNLEWQVRLAAWQDLVKEETWNGRIGGVALPGLSMLLTEIKSLSMDALVVGKVSFYSPEFGSAYTEKKKVDWYRYWLRFSGPRYELRLGNQKINFGPAKLLRSLMWFDRLDPRDPLQLTPGISAVLFRYFWLNNTNLWLWIVRNAENYKGLESLPGVRGGLEPGGRLQIPVWRGQMALTMHSRKLNDIGWDQSRVHWENSTGKSREYRFALDGQWDLEIGLWGELMYSYSSLKGGVWNASERWLTLGADYTFPVWNGVHVLVERMTINLKNDYIGSYRRALLGCMAEVPLGLLDRIQAMIFYDERERSSMFYAIWQRVMDRYTINLAYYSVPDPFISSTIFSSAAFFGEGWQILLVYDL